MPPFRSILLSCLLACFSLNAVAALRIAAQTLDESEPVVETVAATLDHLRARIPADFELNYYAADEMEAVVKEGKADAVIIDAASFASFQKNDGVWALASMKSPLARDSAHTTAAAFIVRADRHDLRKLFKNPRAKPDGTKMFCSAFLNDARMCCFFANAIVKY